MLKEAIFLVLVAISLTRGEDVFVRNMAGMVAKIAEPSMKDEQLMDIIVGDEEVDEPRVDIPGVGGDSNPKVMTTSGEVEGITADGAHAFYEIPYAEPPTGEFRYQPPRPINQSRTIDAKRNSGLQCHQLEAACLIPSNPLCRAVRMDEDCLVVSVFSPESVNLTDPTNPPDQRLPVLVYIHGGAFTGGSGTRTSVDGKELSAVTNMVIVTVNYRLGALGFLVHKQEGFPDILGNQGLKDQQLALTWVQDNIDKFGGDKDKVTISGTSAGGQSVMFHTLSEISRPLYNSAIQQSNPAVYTYQTPEESLEITGYLLKSLRCNESMTERDCLMSAEPIAISNRQLSVMVRALLNRDTMGFIEPYRPIIDGVEFTDHPLHLFRDGKWNNRKSMIIGVASEELENFQYVFPPGLEYGKPLFAAVNYVIFGVGTTDKVVQKYEEEYPPEEDENWLTTFGLEMSHLYFVCPSRAMTRYISETATLSANAYFYVDEHPVRQGSCVQRYNDTERCYQSTHGSDVRFLFRSVNDPDTDDKSVEDQFSTYWGSFARTGSPSNDLETSLGDFADWPTYTSESARNSPSSDVKTKSNLELYAKFLPLLHEAAEFASEASELWQDIRLKAPSSEVGGDYEADICDFWDSIGYYMDPIPLPITTTTEPPSKKTTTSKTIPTTSGAGRQMNWNWLHFFVVFFALLRL